MVRKPSRSSAGSGRTSRSGISKNIHRAGSVLGSIAKSTGSSKRSHRGNRRSSIQDDNRSINSNRSSGTMRSRDGNWTSQSCQQITYARPHYNHQKHVFPLVNSPSLSPKSASSGSGGGSQSVLNPLGQSQAITVPVTNFQKQATFNEAIVY